MKKLIDLTEEAMKALKAESKLEGRSLKAHIEYLLEQRAIEIKTGKKK